MSKSELNGYSVILEELDRLTREVCRLTLLIDPAKPEPSDLPYLTTKGVTGKYKPNRGGR